MHACDPHSKDIHWVDHGKQYVSCTCIETEEMHAYMHKNRGNACIHVRQGPKAMIGFIQELRTTASYCTFCTECFASKSYACMHVYLPISDSTFFIIQLHNSYNKQCVCHRWRGLRVTGMSISDSIFIYHSSSYFIINIHTKQCVCHRWRGQ